MSSRCSIPCQTLLSGAAAIWLWSCGTVGAGEKIQGLEGSPSASTTTPGTEKERVFSMPFEIRPGNPGGGDVHPVPIAPPPSTRSMDPRIGELWDKKKNWMMQDPSRLDRESEMRRAFGIRDSKMNGIGWRDSAASESDSGREPGNSNRPDSPTPTGKPNELSRGGRGADGTDKFQEARSSLTAESNSRSALGPVSVAGVVSGSLDASEKRISPLGDESLPRSAGLFGNMGLPEPFGSRPGSITTGVPGALSPREQGMEEFKQLLSPTSPAGGSLGSRNVGSRNPLDSISGLETRGSSLGLGSGLNGSPVGTGPNLPPISSIAGAFSTIPSAGSSLGAAVVPPASGPIMRPRPAVLELPRRSF